MKTDWQRLASIGICITLAVLALFMLGKYMVAVFLPFFIAWTMAFFTNVISNGILTKIKISKRLCSVIVLILLFLLIGWLLFFSINRFFSELEKFISKLTSDSGALTQSINEIAIRFDNISSHIPLISELKEHEVFVNVGDRIDEVILSFLKSLASDLGTAVTSFATAVVRALPSIILFIIISVIASFYFALDFEAINKWIYRAMPSKIQKKIPRIKTHTKSLAARYLKAYSILMALTFFELYAGLSIIGVDYAFILAVGISFLDVLPILGVGTVLIPWSVISFIFYDFGLGFGLVVLWAIVSIIRQVVEPKIVGGTIGLHPVVTLIGMYVGYRIFGVVGIFLAPVAIIAVRTYLGESAIDTPKVAIDIKAKK